MTEPSETWDWLWPKMRTCVICERPTRSVVGNWCNECAGSPMCVACQNEHAEDHV